MRTYGTDRGDVLLSLQCAQANEAMDNDWLPGSWRSTASFAGGLGGMLVAAPPVSGGPSRAAVDATPLPRHSIAAAPVGPEPTADPETGAGTRVALRRDVDRDLSGRSPDTASFVLLRLTVHPEQQGQHLPEDVGLDVIRCLCEIGPFVLRGRDRIYRTGPHEVTVLLAEASPEGAEAARGRLESATQRAMHDRGHPGVLLAGELMDPATLLDDPPMVATTAPNVAARP